MATNKQTNSDSVPPTTAPSTLTPLACATPIGQPMVPLSVGQTGAVQIAQPVTGVGAINLTISNATIGAMGTGASVLTPPPLTTPQAVNLKIPSPQALNIRLNTATTAAAPPTAKTGGFHPVRIRPGLLPTTTALQAVPLAPGALGALPLQQNAILTPTATRLVAPATQLAPVTLAGQSGLAVQPIAVEQNQIRPINRALPTSVATNNIVGPPTTTGTQIASTNMTSQSQTRAKGVSYIFNIPGSCAKQMATSEIMREQPFTIFNGAVILNRELVKSNKKEKPEVKKDSDQSAGSNENEANMADATVVDGAHALAWKDGVGTLEGTNLKFTYDDKGDIIMCDEAMDDVVTSSTENAAGVENNSKEKDASSVPPSPASSTTSGTTLLSRKNSKKKRKSAPQFDEKQETKLARLDSLDDDEVRRVNAQSKKKSSSFSWSQYLDAERGTAAPLKLFKDPYPQQRNAFKLGMKLEGIDPHHPSLYCCLSVAEVTGFRIRLHFDGFMDCYDFWVNADSPFIFPVSWAEKNGKKLQPPKGYSSESFSWGSYLKNTKHQAAPKHMFTQFSNATVTPNGFRIGMKLEAVDKSNNFLTCVATVNDIIGDRILVHFDGWEDSYDYWSDPTSPYIHPVGWCQENDKPLAPPNDFEDISKFTWEDYLQQTSSSAAPSRAFKPRAPVAFEVGHRVEIVDRRNPVLVRCATIIDKKDHQLQVHFDGWSDVYDYWIEDDSEDIHPPGWCGKTGHPLTPPITPRDLAESPALGVCPTPGCKGVGHVKGAKYAGHHSVFGCPYSERNLKDESNALKDRLGFAAPSAKESVARAVVAPISAPSCEEIRPPSPAVSAPTPAPPVAPPLPPVPFHRGPGRPPKDRTKEREKLLAAMGLDSDAVLCPTPNCDGKGHVNGRSLLHDSESTCPSAARNQVRIDRNTKSIVDGRGKPLVGPGSGRGRKKSQLVKAWKKMHQEPPGEKPVTVTVKTEPVSPRSAAPSSASKNDSLSIQTGVHRSVFLTGMLPPPAKDLSFNWDYHSTLLPSCERADTAQVSSWTPEQVGEFITALPGCAAYAPLFRDEAVDGESFLLLNQSDVVNILKVRLGPAIKIHNSILVLKNSITV